MPTRKPNRLPLPTSGQLIAAVAKALDLDVPDALAGRYFRGESVKPETRDKICVAVATDVLSAAGKDDAPSSVQRAVAAAISFNADRWDDLLGMLGTTARQPREYRAAAPAFAMVMAVDLAIRVGAYWHTTGRAPFQDRAELAAIIEERRGLFVRHLVVQASLTRDQLAERVGVRDATTIDDWLDGRHRPTRANLRRLGDALAPGLGVDSAALARSLRRYFALWRIRQLLRDGVGEHADGILRHFASYAIDACAAFATSKLAKPLLSRSEIAVASQGLAFAPAGHIARHLSRTETLPLWRSILRACSGNSFGLLRWAITALTDLEESGELADDELCDALLFLLCDPTEPPHPAMSSHEWRAMAAEEPRLAAARLEQQGEQRMALEMFHDAAESFRRSLVFDPDSPVLHYRLGCALWRHPSEDRSESRTDDHGRDVLDAEHELWCAYKLAPARKDVLTPQLALAELIWLMLENDRAQDAADLAASLSGRFATLHPAATFAIGAVKRLHRDLEGACAAYRATLQKQPTHLLAYEFLEECHAALRNVRAAKRGDEPPKSSK